MKSLKTINTVEITYRNLIEVYSYEVKDGRQFLIISQFLNKKVYFVERRRTKSTWFVSVSFNSTEVKFTDDRLELTRELQ